MVENHEAKLATGLDAANIKNEESPTAVNNGIVENGLHSNNVSVKQEDSEDEDDMPLAARREVMNNSVVKSETPLKMTIKAEHVKAEPVSPRKEIVQNNNHSGDNKRSHEAEDSDDDDVSLAVRAKKMKKEDDDDYKPDKKPVSTKKSKEHKEKKKKHKKDKHKEKEKSVTKNNKKPAGPAAGKPSPAKKPKKEEKEEQPVWRWWEEDHGDSQIKWKFMEHKGVVFPPPYECLPSSVKFYYDGKVIRLSPEAEEVAGFYARLLDHEYSSRQAFNTNFFKDWRKKMTPEERELITDLSKCNFKEMDAYFKMLSEERKNRSKQEKLKLKEDNQKLIDIYGIAMVDGYKQRIGNFRIEPPGLFRGRGDHPKMGMLKQRIQPEDVIINCSKDSVYPVPPPGHKWKEIRHDNMVTWLASWNENILGSVKYVMLNASSKLKGQKDWGKYEKARELHKCVDRIRESYRADWKDKEMRIRQRAVALYFIDKLALRAGNEKEDGETADTVGCCSLRVEHIKLQDTGLIDGKEQECIVVFDFLGKDSIRYLNTVSVEKRAYKNLKLFTENKDPGDDLFDRLSTTVLNKYLSSLMPGLTAKVFRTYNASTTLQEQLKEITNSLSGTPSEADLVLAYNRANRAVAILCNHQRAASKSHDTQMQNLLEKINTKKHEVRDAKKDRDDAKTDYKRMKNDRTNKILDQKQKKYDTLKKQLAAIEIRATDKEENKEIALGTSKLNYLDPRITVQWCLKYGVNLNKVYNKTQREKFQWAIDMITKDYEEDDKEFEF